MQREVAFKLAHESLKQQAPIGRNSRYRLVGGAGRNHPFRRGEQDADLWQLEILVKITAAQVAAHESDVAADAFTQNGAAPDSQ